MFTDSHLVSMDQVIAIVEKLAGPRDGRTAFVVTAKGDEVKTAFRVLEAADLIVSNNGDGTINPNYPAELQPRDRTRLSSKMQVNNIAKNIRPAQLGDSGLSSHGAPIVGPDNVVESGNGRTMGLLRAYGSGQADGYRQYLIDNAKLYGLKAATVEKMKQPVLVRVRLDDIDRVKFAKDSNISDLQEMAASEKAFVDADSIDQNTMALFQPGESGDLLAKTNQGFIRKFMTEIGATAAAGLMTEDGRPTRQLVDRMQNAIFAKAYKNERLVKLIAEEPDPELRNVLTALNVAAPDFVEMQYLSGEAHKGAVGELVEGIEASNGLDEQAMKSLIEAIGLVREAKDSGQHIQEVIAQQGMFSENTPEGEALALFIVANNRSAKRMGRAFKLMAQKINAELTHQQAAMGDMFGEGDITLPDILKSVSDELESEFGEGATLNMFEAVEEVTNNSEYFPAARDIDDLGNLIYAMIYRDTAQTGQMVGRWFKRLVRGEITRNQYDAMINETLPLWHEENKGVRKGIDRKFNLRVSEEIGDQKAAFYNGTVIRFIVIPGMTMNIPQRAQRWSSITDPQARKAVAIDLLNVWNVASLWTGDTSPSTSVINALEYMSDGILTADEWPKIIAVATGQKVRLRDAELTAAHAKATADGKALIRYDSVKKQVKDSLPGAADDLKRNLLNDFSSLSSNLFRVSDVEFVDYISRVTDAMSLGRMGFHSSDAKKPGMSQGMRYLSAGGKQQVKNALTKVTAPVVNRLYWSVTDVLEKQPASDDQILEVYNGISIHPGLLKAWEGVHGAGMMANVIKWAIKMAGGKISTLKSIEPASKGSRASASKAYKRILLSPKDGPEVLAHEIGHHFEYSNINLLALAIEYLKSRQTGTRLRRMKSLCLGYNYKNDEVAVEDKLSEPYIGKVYGGKMGYQTSTEVFSMAFQYMWDQQAGAESMINEDGLMDFAIGAIKGVHNGEY